MCLSFIIKKIVMWGGGVNSYRYSRANVFIGSLTFELLTQLLCCLLGYPWVVAS